MPIQEKAIPAVLSGKDLIAIAQTGTGKTLAFGLPSLTRLAAFGTVKAQMLVLCPTRELAVQINGVLRPLAKELKLRSICLYGGVNIRPQISELRTNPEVIVATPGRLQDHIDRKSINLKNVQILVLDEADRMLDMGFLPNIKRIISVLPQKRQTLLFSATFPQEIRNKVTPFVHQPQQIEIAPQSTPAESVEQGVYSVMHTDKSSLLTTLLAQPEVTSTLVFTRTKIRADRVAKMLRNSGFNADAIHGNCTQNQRQSAITRFRGGQSKILVATDIAARGIDIKGVSHVINYDMPSATEDYIHRIGRTARAKAKGIALTFASPGEESALRSIEKLIGRKLNQHQWAGAVNLQEKTLPALQTVNKVSRTAKSSHPLELASGEKPPRRKQRKRNNPHKQYAKAR